MDDQRDEHGRFKCGWSGGPGRPAAEHVARLRDAVLRAAKPRDLRRVIAGLIERALDGDVQAARLLLDRILGPPQPADVIERLEALERRMEAWQTATSAERSNGCGS